MTNTKWTKEKELYDRTYPYRLGFLSGACQTAIIQLEVFLKHRKDNLSQLDNDYILDIIKGLKDARENSLNNEIK
jgi:hypothetical protein